MKKIPAENQEMPPSRRIPDALWVFGTWVCFALLGALCAKFLYGVAASDMVFFGIRWRMTPYWLPGLCAVPGAICGEILRRHAKLPAEALFRAMLPALPGGLLLIDLPTFWKLLGFVFCFGWCATRCAALFENAVWEQAEKNSGRRLRFCALILMFLLMFSGIRILYEAYDRLYLCMADWGEYVNTPLQTWAGSKGWGDWPGHGFGNGHFMPLHLIFGTLILGLFPYAGTSFFLAVLILFGSAMLLYLWARKKELPEGMAALLAIIYLLYPSISNLQLGFFYGPNPQMLFIPLFFTYALLRECGHLKWAWAVLAISLLVKETAGVFYFGFGLALICDNPKSWKRGALIAAIGAGYFFLCSKVLVPYLAGQYGFQGQFAALGNTVWEIALSPILRPQAFWGQFLRWKNLQYVILLLLPVFPLIAKHPFLLLGGIFLTVFSFLRGSVDLINICLQYQIETVALILSVMVLSASQKQNDTGLLPGLFAGMKRPAGSSMPLVIGTFVTVILSHYLFAQSSYGAFSFQAVERFEDASEMRLAVNKTVPKGSRIGVSHYAGLPFLFSGMKLSNLDHPENQYRYYNLGGILNTAVPKHLENLRSGNWKLLGVWPLDRRYFYLLGKKSDPAPEFEPGGMDQHTARELWDHAYAGRSDEYCEYRVCDRLFPDRKEVLILTRLRPLREKKPDYLLFSCAELLTRSGLRFSAGKLFGDGAFPLEKLPTDYISVLPVNIPPECDYNIRIRSEVVK